MVYSRDDQNKNIELNLLKHTDTMRNDEKKEIVKGSRYIKYMKKYLSNR
jgi:hypothetical protein